MNKTSATLAELVATFMFASCYLVTKDATNGFPPILLVGFRFLVGALVTAFFCIKSFKQTSKKMLVDVFICSLFQTFGVVLQTIGLKYTTAGKSSFITQAYCIFVPVYELIIYKRKPKLTTILTATICMLGIGLIVLDDGLKISTGDFYTLLAAICMAGQITTFEKMADKYDSKLACCYMLLSSGIQCTVCGLFVETLPTAINTPTLLAIVYLALIGSSFSMMLQGYAQTVLPSSTITIILGFEAVFATILSGFVFHETFTAKCLTGCFLVFLSTFVILLNTKVKEKKK